MLSSSVSKSMKLIVRSSLFRNSQDLTRRQSSSSVKDGVQLAFRVTATSNSPEPLDLLDVVQRQVQVLQVLHVVQVLHLGDDVVLKVEDLQLPARRAQHLCVSASDGQHTSVCRQYSRLYLHQVLKTVTRGRFSTVLPPPLRTSLIASSSS